MTDTNTDLFGIPNGYQTREDWLNAFIERARPHFEAAGAPLPAKVRVAIGFTSRGQRGKVIGECWSSDCSEDGHFEIFIKPTLQNAARICDVLTHELIHAACGIAEGHGMRFRRVMTSLGLKGKATATVAGEDWYRWALPVIEALGPFPFGQMATGEGEHSGRKKQVTYLRKIECTECGWAARCTTKNFTLGFRCVDPTCDGTLLMEGGQ